MTILAMLTCFNLQCQKPVGMKHLIEYAISFVGTPYRWGGDDPMEGYDCSGLVQEILASVGEDPPGDQTAQRLYDHFEKNGRQWAPHERRNNIHTGALAFFGPDTRHIKHVGFMIDAYRMVEAGGGGRSTASVNDAAKQNAFVRIRPVDSRDDLVAIIKPHYTGIGRFW